MSKFNSCFVSRLLAILAMLFLLGGYGVTASAVNTTFYGHFYVNDQPTGAGKVYISETSTKGTNTSIYYHTSEQHRTEATEMVDAKTYYIFAEPMEGYAFDKWTVRYWSNDENKDYSKNTNYISFADAHNPNTTVTFKLVSSNSQKPDSVFLTAHFIEEGAVKIKNNDNQLGTSSISSVNNKTGDVVTLTAQPYALASTFVNWTGPDGSIVSTEPSFDLTITNDNKGEYTANFASNNISDKGLYCMIYRDNRFYLGLRGTSNSLSYLDGKYPYAPYAMMESNNSAAVHSSPAFILKLKGDINGAGGLTNATIISQGIDSKKETGLGFTVTKMPEHYYMQTSLSGFTGYLYDKTSVGTQEHIGSISSPYGLSGANEGDGGYWWLFEPITESDNKIAYFGAQPTEKSKIGDRYYTTMYAAFPYKCLDNVKAYTVDGIGSDGVLSLKEILGDVPSNTPVILSCTSTSPSQNRLLPLIDEPSTSIGTNLLKGDIWIISDSKDINKGRTSFDANTMRVLNYDDATFKNVNNTDILSDGKTGVMQYIGSNTAYLDISNETNKLDEYKLFPDKAELTIDGNNDVDNWTNGAGKMQVADVTFTRNITTAGGWYTLCLPFDIDETQLKDAFGENVDLEEYESAENGDNVTFNFHKVNELKAGHPYLIRVVDNDFSSYTFKDVTISGNDISSVDMGNGYTFQGTAQYNSEDITADKYEGRARFLNAKAKLVRPKSNGKILPTRCFFLYPEGTTTESAKNVSFTFDNDTPTGINAVDIDEEDIQKVDNRIFSITGQYLGTDFSRLPKGLYIVNGKKVMK